MSYFQTVNPFSIIFNISYDLHLAAYRILVASSDEIIQTFDWNSAGNTWFSWNATDVNLMGRSSNYSDSATSTSNVSFPVPGNYGVDLGIIQSDSNYTITITDPHLGDFAGDVYCLLKIQAKLPGRRLNMLNVNPSGTLVIASDSIHAAEDFANFYTDAAITSIRGNGGNTSGAFSGAFIQSDSFGVFNAADDVGQILFKFTGEYANQTQANLDGTSSFSMTINC